jgi:hypothetical protein
MDEGQALTYVLASAVLVPSLGDCVGVSLRNKFFDFHHLSSFFVSYFLHSQKLARHVVKSFFSPSPSIRDR